MAVFDATRRNLRRAMQIMTAADMELKARGNRKFRYRVVEDGCKVRCLDAYAGILVHLHSIEIIRTSNYDVI